MRLLHGSCAPSLRVALLTAKAGTSMLVCLDSSQPWFRGRSMYPYCLHSFKPWRLRQGRHPPWASPLCLAGMCTQGSHAPQGDAWVSAHSAAGDKAPCGAVPEHRACSSRWARLVPRSCRLSIGAPHSLHEAPCCREHPEMDSGPTLSAS